MNRRPLSAACAAATGLALVAAPALAATAPADGPPPLTVYVGGNDSGTYHFTGVSKGDVTFTAGSLVLTCSTSTIGGTITAGSYTSSPADIADIGSVTFSACAAGSPFPVTLTPQVPWALDITDVTPPDDVDGHSHSADGDIAGFGVSIDLDTGLADCAFDIGGAVNVEIDVQTDGSTQELRTIGDLIPLLEVSNVSSGCLGLISEGDPASFQGAYDLAVAGVPNPPIGFTNP